MTRDKHGSAKTELTPPRPKDGTESETSLLTPPLKAAWLDLVTPSPDARTRVWNALAKTTRSGVVSATVARVDREMAVRALGAPPTSWRGGLLVKGIAGAVLLTGVLVVALVHPRTAPVSAARVLQVSSPRSVITSTSASPAPPAAPPIAAATRAEEHVAALVSPHVAKHLRPHAHAVPVEVAAAEPALAEPASPASPGAPARLDLASELKLLRSAAKALAAEDPVTALQLLDRHDALYPSSPMAKEKTALRIMAACALARPDAQRECDAFLRSEQHSPLGERVRQACAELR
jgi:hypothetical protein